MEFFAQQLLSSFANGNNGALQQMVSMIMPEQGDLDCEAAPGWGDKTKGILTALHNSGSTRRDRTLRFIVGKESTFGSLMHSQQASIRMDFSELKQGDVVMDKSDREAARRAEETLRHKSGMGIFAPGPFSCEYPALSGRTGAFARLTESVFCFLHPLQVLPTSIQHQSVVIDYVITAAETRSIEGVPLHKRWIMQAEARLSHRGMVGPPVEASHAPVLAPEAAISGMPYMMPAGAAAQNGGAPQGSVIASLCQAMASLAPHTESPASLNRLIQRLVLQCGEVPAGHQAVVRIDPDMPCSGAPALPAELLQGKLPTSPPPAAAAEGGAAADTASLPSSDSRDVPVLHCSTYVPPLLCGPMTPLKLAELWRGVLADHRQLTADIPMDPAFRKTLRCTSCSDDEKCDWERDLRCFPPVFMDGVGLSGLLKVQVTGLSCTTHGGCLWPHEYETEQRMFWLHDARGRDLLYYRLACGAVFVCPRDAHNIIWHLTRAWKREQEKEAWDGSMGAFKRALVAWWRVAMISRLNSKLQAVNAMCLALAARGVPAGTARISLRCALQQHILDTEAGWHSFLAQDGVAVDLAGMLGRAAIELEAFRDFQSRHLIPDDVESVEDPDSEASAEASKMKVHLAVNEDSRTLHGECEEEGVTLSTVRQEALDLSFEALREFLHKQNNWTIAPPVLFAGTSVPPCSTENAPMRRAAHEAALQALHGDNVPQVVQTFSPKFPQVDKWFPHENFTNAVYLTNRVPDAYRHDDTSAGLIVSMQAVPIYERSLLKIVQRCSGFGLEQVVVLRRFYSALDGADRNGHSGLDLPLTHGFVASHNDFQLFWGHQRSLFMPYVVKNLFRVARPDADGAPEMPRNPVLPGGKRTPTHAVMGHAASSSVPPAPLFSDEDVVALVMAVTGALEEAREAMPSTLPETQQLQEWLALMNVSMLRKHQSANAQHGAILEELIGNHLDVWLLQVDTADPTSARFTPAMPRGACPVALASKAASSKPAKKQTKKKAAKKKAKEAHSTKKAASNHSCEWVQGGTQETDMLCWGGWMVRNVRVGMYTCTKHGCTIPMELRPGVGINDGSFLMTHTQRTGNPTTFPSAGAGSVQIEVRGMNIVLTPEIAQMCVLGLLGAVHHARKARCSMWAEDAPVKPIAMALRIMQSALAHRLRALKLDLEQYFLGQFPSEDQRTEARRALAGAMWHYGSALFGELRKMTNGEFFLEVFRQVCALCAPWVLDGLRQAGWPLPPMLQCVGMSDQLAKTCILELARSADLSTPHNYGTLKGVTTSMMGGVSNFQKAKKAAAASDFLWAEA